jgi:plasmid stabilization system protein ParE
MKIFIRREAEQDIADARSWYQQRSPQSAQSFIASLNHTLTRIAEFPHAFPRAGKRTRRALLTRFPYTVYFCETGAHIEVHAVFHQSRKPQPRLVR